MLLLPVAIDVNRISTSLKKRRVAERLELAPVPSARPAAPRPAERPKTPEQTNKTRAALVAREQPTIRSSPPHRPLERRQNRSATAPAQDESRRQRHRQEMDAIRQREARDAAHAAQNQARALARVEDIVINSLTIALDALEEGKALQRSLQDTTRIILNRYHADSPPLNNSDSMSNMEGGGCKVK